MRRGWKCGRFFVRLKVKRKGGERMDQLKIGRFIAAERKRQGLTQRQLAEQLSVSDKTISKWECGVSHS